MRLRISAALLLSGLVALGGCKSEKNETTAYTETTASTAPAPETVVGTATAPIAVQPATPQPGVVTSTVGNSPIVITQTQVPGQTPLQPMETMLSTIPRIVPEVAKAEIDKGDAVMIDVRGMAYANGHVKGALDIPETQLPYRMAALPKDKKLITYCT